MTKEKGRPEKYNKSFLPKINNLVILGCSNKKIAEIIGISEQTFYNWMNEYPEIKESITETKNTLSFKLSKSLLKRATGYNYKETIIKDGEEVTCKKYMHSDVRALQYLLKNIGLDRELEHKILMDKEKLELEKFEKWLDKNEQKTYTKLREIYESENKENTRKI